jgi:hypothetical protein
VNVQISPHSKDAVNSPGSTSLQQDDQGTLLSDIGITTVCTDIIHTGSRARFIPAMVVYFVCECISLHMILTRDLIHPPWKCVHLHSSRFTSFLEVGITQMHLDHSKEEALALHPPAGLFKHIQSAILGLFKTMEKGGTGSSRWQSDQSKDD